MQMGDNASVDNCKHFIIISEITIKNMQMGMKYKLTLYS